MKAKHIEADIYAFDPPLQGKKFVSITMKNAPWWEDSDLRSIYFYDMARKCLEVKQCAGINEAIAALGYILLPLEQPLEKGKA